MATPVVSLRRRLLSSTAVRPPVGKPDPYAPSETQIRDVARIVARLNFYT